MARPSSIYLETGTRWVFACAIEWPGWCRRGRSEETAVEALTAYGPRYRAVVGPAFSAGEIIVVGRIPGNATTDFGAPSAIGPWDDEPTTSKESRRQMAILEASWQTFDEVLRRAPAELRKGPRGGGRDRDEIADHVRDAERSYAAKIGLRVPPRTPWGDQRDAISTGLQRPDRSGAWPTRYALRRLTWHVLDHAWEIEDRGTSGPSPH